MPKFLVYEVATASYFVGEYEADTKEDAEALADAEPQNDAPCLCHQCAGDLELGEFYQYQTDAI